MLALVDAATAAGARHLTLEVRVSNEGARRLYQRFGFAPVGVRKDYYRDEDALVMWATDIDNRRIRRQSRCGSNLARGSLMSPTAQPLILGIETSCDETGVAVLEGFNVRSSVLASQTDAHARFGGVVPEVAARAHVEAIRPLVHLALAQAGVHSDQLGAVAATRGPGLAGALIVGVSFAKASPGASGALSSAWIT